MRQAEISVPVPEIILYNPAHEVDTVIEPSALQLLDCGTHCQQVLYLPQVLTALKNHLKHSFLDKLLLTIYEHFTISIIMCYAVLSSLHLHTCMHLCLMF